MIVWLDVSLLKGMFGYRITEVWQLKDEEGRGEDRNRCCSLEVWRPHSSSWQSLTQAQSVTEHLSYLRYRALNLQGFREKWEPLVTNDWWTLLFCARQDISFFLTVLEYLEVRKAAGSGKDIQEIVGEEFKEREDNNHLPAYHNESLHHNLCSTNLPNTLRKDWPHVLTLSFSNESAWPTRSWSFT